MRFCMVTTFYPPYSFGGDADYVRALSLALIARGHTVRVVHCIDAYTIKSRKLPQEAQAPPGLDVVSLRNPFGRLSPLLTQQSGRPMLKAAALRRALNGSFDVIHFHNISLVGGPAVLGMGLAPVKLYTLHEHWLVCPTHILWKNRAHACDRPTCLSCSLRSGIPPQLWRYGGLVSRSLQYVDRLLAPSEFTARRHADLARNRVPITVLPLFSRLPESDQGSQARDRFLFVGRLERSKGVLALAQAFAVMPMHRLDIVGTGPLEAELRTCFGDTPNITLRGWMPQSELPKLYQRAVALIFPSLCPETFGLTIAEAMACGTPVIVHAGAGGAPELVEQTGGGIVYQDAQTLAAAVRRLSEDAMLAAKLGTRAREGCRRYYSETVHLDRYLALVSEVRATSQRQAM